MELRSLIRSTRQKYTTQLVARVYDGAQYVVGRGCSVTE